MKTPEKDAAEPPEERVRRSEKLNLWLSAGIARGGRMAYLAWTLAAIAWLLVPVAIYISWYLGSGLWHWARAANLYWLTVPLALFLSLFLVCIPIWIGMFATSVTSAVADATFAGATDDVAKAKARVRETEEDALNRLESTDKAGLLPLLRYSRAQLDAYYAIGLKQTRRSFINAVIAMWLGFLILVLGMGLYIVPTEQLHIARPTADFQIVIIGSAAIIEFISALFLWVYRSTIGQLTFYYRLQMQSHTAILSFRMSTTMGDQAADEAKHMIIERMLNSSTMPERPEQGSRRDPVSLLAQGAKAVVP